MNIPITAKKASTMAELRQAWSRDQPKRANGGWWALSGFTFQMIVALEDFFRSSLSNEQVPLAMDVEALSDVLLAGANETALTQVKRTLTKSALQAAVREAYEIVALCSPELRRTLRFQIVCQSKETPFVPGNLDPNDLFENEKVDHSAFAETLARFDQAEPIRIAAHPAFSLMLTLWNAGVDDPATVAALGLGDIFAAFDGRNRADIGTAIFAMVRRVKDAIRKPRMIGRLLGPSNFVVRPTNAHESIYLNWRPRVTDLVQGRFLTRQVRLQTAKETAKQWLARTPERLGERRNKLRVLCISGRPGDGKSVLLLQLVGDLLVSGKLSSITELRDDKELKEWIESRPTVDSLQEGQSIEIGFLDDLPSQLSAEGFDRIVDDALYRGDRAAALITCGPADSIRTLVASTRLDITLSELMPPDHGELEAFRHWLRERTGRPIENRSLTSSSLANWLYSAGTSIDDVPASSRVRRRLEELGLFLQCRIAAAVNACALAAPSQLFEADALARLANLEIEIAPGVRLHPDVTASDVRLAHAEIVRPLYTQWTAGNDEAPVTTWGRDLGAGIVAFLESDNVRSARALLGQLMDGRVVRRLLQVSRGSAIELVRRSLLDAIWERILVTPIDLWSPLMPLWLAAGRAGGISDVHVNGLRKSAAEFLDSLRGVPLLRAEIAVSLLRTSKHQEEGESAATTEVLKSTERPIIYFLQQRIRKNGETTKDALTSDWLARHKTELAASTVLNAAIGTADEATLDLAYDFVEHFKDRPESGTVLWNLTLRSKYSRRYRPIVDRWLTAPSEDVAAARIFTRRLASPVGADYISRALRWVSGKRGLPGVQEVLAGLAERAPDDEEITRTVDEWLSLGPPLADAAPVLVAMLRAQNPRKAIQKALEHVDRAPADPAAIFITTHVRDVLRGLTPVQHSSLAAGLSRGPRNVLDQIIRRLFR